MADAHFPARRRLLPGVMALALVVLTGISVQRFLALRAEMADQVRSQLEDQLQDRVGAWEDALVDELQTWLESAGQDPAGGWATEVQLRGREPWFDSLYVWRPRHESVWRGRIVPEAAEFLYPPPPPDELDGPDGPYNRDPCLPPIGTEGDDPHAAAKALVAGCSHAARPVRLLAASRASALLADAGDEDGALAVLDAAIAPDTTLRAAIQQGIDPYRVFMNRHQRAEILDRLGRREEALDLLFSSGIEACDLAAPEYAKVRGWIDFAARKPLRAARRTEHVDRLGEAIARAERRFRAYEEIGQRILPQPILPASQGPRFIYDQYSSTPFLLFYGPVRTGDMGAAVQLEQPVLLADLLSTLRRFRGHVVIIDSRGDWVAGSREAGPIAVEVPFARTLTHLRIGLKEAAVVERTSALDGQWTIPLIVVSVVAGLGAIAIGAQIRADRQLDNLLARQREFTARVTHELKTPLAGIKVMAENLEDGAFDTDLERADMARSIVREADRLHRRVEEILAVAKERHIPDPEPFDPEEALLEAIDQWGPRLEQAGVRLQADLDTAREVVGDAGAIRDAVGCLLDNALKYHDESKANPQVWLTLRQDGPDAVIDVADNGLGVPAEMRDAIFERFVRVEGPNRGKAGGHGLGLAQVRDIVAEHKGRVTCGEGVDGGARFVIRLPTAPE